MVQTTFLYYLVQIAHYQSLSIAADELHVSQPALSSGIKKLEEQLGAKLLERTYKGVTLTEEGKEVVELAKKAFGYLDEIEHKFLQPKMENEKNTIADLSIYCNPAYSPHIMTILSSNKTSEKNILQLFDLTPNMSASQLVRENPNNVVLGIVSDLHELPQDLAAIKICTSQAYIMCTSDFPYVTDKKTISFKELVHVPLSILNDSLSFQRILLDGIRHYGVPNIKVISQNSATVSSAVYSGNAASFYNNFFQKRNNKSYMRYLPIRNAPKFHLSLIIHHDANQSKIEQLVTLLKENLL